MSMHKHIPGIQSTVDFGHSLISFFNTDKEPDGFALSSKVERYRLVQGLKKNSLNSVLYTRRKRIPAKTPHRVGTAGQTYRRSRRDLFFTKTLMPVDGEGKLRTRSAFPAFVPAAVFLILCIVLPSNAADRVLAWKDCIATARTHHPDLDAGLQSVYQAKQAVKIKNTALKPRLDASGNWNVSGITSTPSDTWSAGFTLSGDLYPRGRIRLGVESAGQALKREQFLRKLDLARLRFELRRAFINMLAAQKMIDITSEILARRKTGLELVRLRYKAGREHAGALAAAEAKLNRARYGQKAAVRDLAVARSALAAAMGLENPPDFSITGSLTPAELQKSGPDFTRLARNHPSFLSSAADIRAMEFELKIARSQQKCSILAHASAERTWAPDTTVNSAGISLNIPLFDGGLIQAQELQAQSRLRLARLKTQSLVLSLESEMKNRWRNFQDAADYVKVRESFSKAALQRSRIAQAQYKTGLISFDTWIIIEDERVSSAKALLRARADAMTARAQWLFAMGNGGLEK